MNDETNTSSEIDTLKERADTLGIKYHPTIGLDKLREKVNAAVTGSSDAIEDGEEGSEAVTESLKEMRVRQKREASELVRIQITNMNSSKRDYDGEVFCTGNRFVGTFKRYVPFDVPWHVERAIYTMIKQRQCQVFVTERDDRGRQVRRGKVIKEYNVEVLPPLTEQELKALAQRQAMASGTQAQVA